MLENFMIMVNRTLLPLTFIQEIISIKKSPFLIIYWIKVKDTAAISMMELVDLQHRQSLSLAPKVETNLQRMNLEKLK